MIDLMVFLTFHCEQVLISPVQLFLYIYVLTYLQFHEIFALLDSGFAIFFVKMRFYEICKKKFNLNFAQCVF